MAVRVLVKKMTSMESPGKELGSRVRSRLSTASPVANVSLTKSKRKELGSKVSDTERRENAVGSEPDEETSGGLVIGPQVLRNSLCRNDRGNCQQTAHRPAEFSEVGKRAHRYLESPFRPW